MILKKSSHGFTGILYIHHIHQTVHFIYILLYEKYISIKSVGKEKLFSREKCQLINAEETTEVENYVVCNTNLRTNSGKDHQ